ncbi:helix-turn-helix domain-containing protein [Enterococcus cecorum]|uniref:Helix-turn-helix transcriptional regulator n=2 Tax=Enterococcus cecorum TaxID=44008 RepID=A0AAW8TTT8_9ENTE|nr:helix-turn-helix transcriptional regulator [Enterococcus cecorum]MDT2797584.1 helix-turn-helix transcriptional regulator [Enterococcus cecorum]
MKPNKKRVGERIHQIRASKDMTMEEFGSLIESSPKSTVNNWEKGNTLPSKSKLEKIALIGGCSIDWLKYGSIEEYISDFIEDKFDKEKLSKDFIMSKLLPLVKKNGLSYNDDLKILSILNNLLNDLENKNFFPLEQQKAQNKLNIIFEKDISHDSLNSSSFNVLENLVKDSFIGIDGILKNEFNDKKIVVYLEIIYLIRCLIKSEQPQKIDSTSLESFLVDLNDKALLQYDELQQERWKNSIFNKDDYDFTSEDRTKIIDLIKNKLSYL